MSSGGPAPQGYASGERSKAVPGHQPPQDARAAEWQRPATWPAWKEAPTPSDDAPHVVLSTKFDEPWYTVSRGLKEILQERGCTVYNPNTDNKEPRAFCTLNGRQRCLDNHHESRRSFKEILLVLQVAWFCPESIRTPLQEIYGDAADARWLLTFNENLEKVKSSRGFVLQIQQGVVRERSPMQLAEEKQSGWLQVPRIGYFAFANKSVRGGGTKAEQYMDDAITAAKAQWQKGVWQEVQVVSEMFEAVEGQLQLDERGLVEGLARCTWPHGETYEGSYHQGKRHGHGVNKRADGSSYVGQYRDGLMHGRGTFQWADGTVAVFTFEADQPKGLGVRLEKASSRYVLLKDGKTEREIDRAEAWQSDLRDVFRGGNSCRSMPG